MNDQGINSVCDICDEKHGTENCPLVNSVNKVEDQAIPSRARLTLPANFTLKEKSSGQITILCLEKIDKGTQFGPLEAPFSNVDNDEIDFKLIIFDEDGSFVYLNTSNELVCNWMCLIKSTKNKDDQNLVAYQVDKRIYFAAQCDIDVGDELSVGYAAGYLKKIERILSNGDQESTDSIATKSDDKRTKYDDLHLEVFRSKVDSKNLDKPESHENDQLENFVENEEVQSDDSIKPKWKCSKCGGEFNVCSEFGLHLQEHLRPMIQIEQSTHVNRKTNDTPDDTSVLDEVADDNSDTNEVHIIISTSESPKYNFRRNRKRTIAFLENEETATLHKQTKEKKSKSLGDDGEIEACEVSMESEDQTVSEDINEKTRSIDDNLNKDSKPNNLKEGENASDSSSCEQTLEALFESSSCKCEICFKEFAKPKYLFRHLRKHTGEFTCYKCHRAFARNESLLSHSCTSMIADEEDCSLEFSCNFCSKSFGTSRLFARHLAKHKGQIKCGGCGSHFINQEKFENHDCPTKSGKCFECDICFKKFSQQIYLNRHIPIHTGEHKCSICEKILRSNESLQHHIKICSNVQEIESNGNIKCEMCSEAFTDAKVFRRHIYEHSHPHICSKCGARFKNSVSLGLHVCSPKTCKTCGRKFATMDRLEKHLYKCGSQFMCEKCLHPFQVEELLKQHKCNGLGNLGKNTQRKKKSSQSDKESDDKSSLICEFCGSMFSSLSSLNVHKTLHGEKKFVCEQCGKKFHRKDLLQEHESVHGEPTIECTICHKMLKTRKSLEVHMMIHRGIKRFKCDQCSKAFIQKGNLRKHLETHCPEKRHECYVCQRSFSTKEYLKIHQLEHSQGKIHNCNICGRSFLKNHQLKTHIKMFHGNVSYVCRYCGLSVKLRHSLKRHLEKKHAYLKNEWDRVEILSSMAVKGSDSSVQQLVIGEDKLTDSCHKVQIENEDKSGPDVLLAVAGLGNEALEKAIAEGKAQVRPGVNPNTIEISLPFGMEGEELTRSLLQNSQEVMEENPEMAENFGNDESRSQNLKLFGFQESTDSYEDSPECRDIVESECDIKNDQEDDNLKAKLIATAQTDENSGETAEGMIVKLQDENGSEIILNPVNNKTDDSVDMAMSDGQVLLYFVADQVGES